MSGREKIIRVMGGVEGAYTGKNLSEYEALLGFNRKLLQGKTVFNYGCGGSNISGELKRAGITSRTIDLDLKFDPDDVNAITGGKLDSRYAEGSWQREAIVFARRQVAQTHDRTFVQANGRHLPFADRTFDITFALTATYQTPPEDKEQIYEELLRVSDVVHVHPVEGGEYAILSRVARLKGFEIIHSGVPEEDTICIETSEDYEKYKQSKSQSERVKVPDPDFTEIHFVDGVPVSVEPPFGTMVILRRKDLAGVKGTTPQTIE